jgi:serine/threonine protein kinase
MKALLETIKNLHEIGIIHRDLKLENILMKLEGGKFIPKIIDFGLSIYQVDLANIE